MRHPVARLVRPLPNAVESNKAPVLARPVLENTDTRFIFVVDPSRYRDLVANQTNTHLMTLI